MENIMCAQNICKEFNNGEEKIRVLSDINIELKCNKITLLKGRSGSGKTTLMNIMGALDNPTSGKVTYNNKEISSYSTIQKDNWRRKEVSFVFQSIALLPHMTAFDNVEFMLRIAGLKIDKHRIENCLERVGLKERMKQLVPMLSGGEQQRVAIARAMVHRPKVIFADEPTSQLDSKMSSYMISLFRKCIIEDGTTVLITSHDQHIADLVDCIYTLEDGRVSDYVCR
jgi:putative ABC transport system ATP-binding protein